jgi:Zn-dependent M16 (insulinase) family peptidase
MILKNFITQKTSEVPELQCTVTEFLHKKTGAKILHIANKDPENVFCIALKTLPKTSNGVAHILEHTVLCGSKKYPVKDPFFSMTRRSLNTFMNAFTGTDFTLYPASSQVKKDFYNLLSVYVDAVFHPNIKKLAFLQEGHRLEFEEPENPKSPLLIKGIVYNEMKGDQSSPEARLGDFLLEKLFPHTTYGYNSGGDPKVIPELSYEELVQFHQDYYHPSRALFYFYGDLPIEEHLQFLEENVFKGVEKLPPLVPMEKEPPFFSPKHYEGSYPVDSDEEIKDKTYFSFSWLTADILEQDDLFALSVIEILLMGTDASVLKKNLLESGLCKEAVLSSHDEFSQVPITITLKGCNPEGKEKLRKILFDTLKAVAKKGFDPEMVEFAIHQIEFYKSEILGNNLPFGMILFFRAGLLAQHGGNPTDGLVVLSLCDRLRKRLKEEPKFLNGLVEKYFVKNNHLIEVMFCPDKTLSEKEEREEKERIKALKVKRDEKEIIAQATELLSYQNQDLDPSCLPKIGVEEIPKVGKEYLLEKEKLESINLFYHDTFTNHIVYSTLIWDLPSLTPQELPIVRFLCNILPQIGCGKRSWEETINYQLAHIGNVRSTNFINLQANNLHDYTPSFSLSGKALYRKADKLFTLMHEMATSAHFNDPKRLLDLLQKHLTDLEVSLKTSPLSWAIGVAASNIDIPSKVDSLMGGLNYFKWVKEHTLNFERHESHLIASLQDIYHRLFQSSNPELILTCSQEMKQRAIKENFWGLLNDFKTKRSSSWNIDVSVEKVPNQARTIASPVSNNVSLLQTVPYTHPDSGALAIASNLFNNLVLHPKIREKGGAYGVGSSLGTLNGIFTFYSTRDPNISLSFAAFQEAVSQISLGNFSKEDLEEAKLEIIQDLDSPIKPGSRGTSGYFWLRSGKTQEVRQAWRDRMLAVTKQDVMDAVSRQLFPKWESATSVVFAGRDLIEREKEKSGLLKGMIVQEVLS